MSPFRLGRPAFCRLLERLSRLLRTAGQCENPQRHMRTVYASNSFFCEPPIFSQVIFVFAWFSSELSSCLRCVYPTISFLVSLRGIFRLFLHYHILDIFFLHYLSLVSY